MVTNKTYEYGIKYRVIKIAPEQFLLLPVSLEGGLSDGFEFSTGKEVIHIANTKGDLRNKYVMDNVYLTTELEEIYNYSEDTDVLSSLFYKDYRNIVYVVNVKDGELHKHAIDLSKFNRYEYDMTYHMDKSLPVITLNQDCLDEILSCDDPKEMRVLLEKYKSLVKSFGETNKKSGVTSKSVSDGKVTSVEVDKKRKSAPKLEVATKQKIVPYGGKDVSFEGLAKYIKERIYGHDEEIDVFAQKMYMNYTTAEGDKIYSILLVGPTGTGKTETVRCAKDYLGLPYVEHNAANLVPQGIQGTSAEDLLITLYLLSGRDLKKAQRGIIFLDEFDKLGLEAFNQKKSVKQILLTLIDGGLFHLRND